MHRICSSVSATACRRMGRLAVSFREQTKKRGFLFSTCRSDLFSFSPFIDTVIAPCSQKFLPVVALLNCNRCHADTQGNQQWSGWILLECHLLSLCGDHWSSFQVDQILSDSLFDGHLPTPHGWMLVALSLLLLWLAVRGR